MQHANRNARVAWVSGIWNKIMSSIYKNLIYSLADWMEHVNTILEVWEEQVL